MDPLTAAQRRRLATQLTIAGWLLLGAQFGFFLFQLERVRGISPEDGRFASAWDRRIEVLSFIMLPPNIVVLAPAAGVAVWAAFVAGSERDQWLTTLIRLVAGAAITMFFIGIPAVIEIATREGGSGEFDQEFMRLGGMSFAAGITVLCRIADTVPRSPRP